MRSTHKTWPWIVTVAVIIAGVVYYSSFVRNPLSTENTVLSFQPSPNEKPASSNNSGTNLMNPWGDKLTASPQSSRSTTQSAPGQQVAFIVDKSNRANFNIVHSAVSAGDCEKMVSSLSANVDLIINGAAQRVPVDPKTAVGLCNHDANTIAITVKHFQLPR